jgi:aspartyl-tRNA(Asn)/glutamyl-tRNA(Gln) amidotransferase subunit A
MHLHDLTIKKFHEGLKKKEFRALEITEGYLNHIETKDKEINAYLTLLKEDAIKQAEEADLAVERGEPISPLTGVPIALKDNMLVEGHRATAGSKILEHYTAAYDAHVVKNLKRNKAVILGKTNLDEFAMGSSTENSAFQVTKNPHDLTRVPGGSSGGSAAAVAAHMALAALGSDTGGSIRQPAALTGVVGLKPTYGAVSRHGLIAMASSLDQIGPFTKTVEDTAILFKAIAGRDQFDSTSVDVEYGEELLNPSFEKIKKMKIGLPEEYFTPGLDPEVAKSVEKAIEKIKTLGIETKRINLPHTKYALSCYYIIMPAEVSSNLARFDGIRYGRTFASEEKNLLNMYKKEKGHGFGAETKRRIILGTFVLSSGYYDAYYAKAQKVRALIRQDFVNAFKDVDAILTPVTPTPAFKIGEKTSDPLQMYLSDIFTIPANLAGLPAVAIPVEKAGLPGVSIPVEKPETGKLPIGFQLVGKPWHEADILGIGQFYERI